MKFHVQGSNIQNIYISPNTTLVSMEDSKDKQSFNSAPNQLKRQARSQQLKLNTKTILELA